MDMDASEASFHEKYQKSSRGPKFDGDPKQTLEIRVKRKRNSRSQKLEEVVSFKKRDLKKKETKKKN